MNMNTLRGIFPEPRPAPKRNFVRENMASIKQMQGIVQSLKASGVPQPVVRGRDAITIFKRKSRSASGSRMQQQQQQQLQQQHQQQQHHLQQQQQQQYQNQQIEIQKRRIVTSKVLTAEKPQMVTVERNFVTVSPRLHRYSQDDANNSTLVSEQMKSPRSNRGRDVAIQTEVLTRRLYDNGTIMYPSNNLGESVLSVKTKQKSVELKNVPQQRNLSTGRPAEGDKEDVSPTVREKKDFVKENAQVVKNLQQRFDKNNAGNPPATYKKGVVPKYIRDRKEELYRQAKSMEGDEKCPDGHVLLPENERKETLRMLRQSYAELITELNLMPVRSDTLKIRNRKIELENQLKKLDEGIKVFTRPKVYVKIGA